MVNLCFKSYRYILIYRIFTCLDPDSYSEIGIRIQIHKGPEYGSNLARDPQHWLAHVFTLLDGRGAGAAS